MLASIQSRITYLTKKIITASIEAILLAASD